MADSHTAGYADFDLRISSEGGKYFAQVLSAPSLADSSEKVALRTPFFPNVSMRELMLTLELAVLKSKGTHRLGGPMSREEGILRDFGSEMYKIVFREPSAIAAAFQASLMLVEQRREDSPEGLRVKLRVEPPELASLPWEYVYDELRDQYLCLVPRSPFVRFLSMKHGNTPILMNGPLNILGMIANPGGAVADLDVEGERKNIEAAIGELQQKGDVNFRWVQGDTRQNLSDMMEQQSWHVFHFIGHGGSAAATLNAGAVAGDGDDDAQGFVVLGDGRGGTQQVFADELKYILQLNNRETLRLAVLNCCESARSASGRAFSSPAAALISAGIPAVVAMQFPISDQAAVEFSRRFYASLAQGQSIERAVTSARVAMMGGRNFEWGIPVLFTAGSAGSLFPRRTRPADAGVQAGQPPAATPADTVSQDFLARQQIAREELRRLFSGRSA
jgi:hypothetical protein